MQVWSTNNIEGVHRFLARVYRLIAEQPLSQDEASREQMRLLHATIKKVSPPHACRLLACLPYWDVGQLSYTFLTFSSLHLLLRDFGR